jgi:hypothetical protein
MQSTGPFDAGNDLAPEIVFRLDPSVDAGGIPETYQCNFDLVYDQLAIFSATPELTSSISQVNVTPPASFTQATPFVLDVVVTGEDVMCTLTIEPAGVVATVSASGLTRTMGTFGLKTFTTTAAYEYFRVYSVP